MVTHGEWRLLVGRCAVRAWEVLAALGSGDDRVISQSRRADIGRGSIWVGVAGSPKSVVILGPIWK